MEQENFKKPVLIGKVGRLPKKIINKTKSEIVPNPDGEREPPNEITSDEKPTLGENSVRDENVEVNEVERKTPVAELSYKEPEWSGLPDTEEDYVLEVLKSGKIIERINLMKKPFVVIGRLDDCDITMAHPTISRYHAILQYRKLESEGNPKGFYLYDLTSTHGTFLNKSRLKPRIYVKLYVGHMIKLGCSTRTYLLVGPAEDSEEESALTVTELKQKRKEELENRQREEEDRLRKLKEEEEALAKKIEERGVDWGMGDDADEETDLSENPYAQTNNEELYIDDPKKALRGFFEREGLDLEYDCTEQGPGQFLCKVQLPLDDERGKPIFAEILHKGKKKEAVIQCALEACRILDRHGILRQATHESRKRKAKNWEENDFYDSDDDTFLDRTGVIEKKRENRMKSKVPQQPETYQSLVDKEARLQTEINNIEKQLVSANKSKKQLNETKEEDSLESYMKELKSSNKLDKERINKLKIDLQKLKGELETVKKLLGIAKPTNLPALINNEPTSKKTLNKKLPIFGKRLKVKVSLPQRSEIVHPMDDEEECETEKIAEKDPDHIEKTTGEPTKPSVFKKPTNDFIKDWNKIEISFNRTYPLMPHNHEHYISLIWKHLKRLHPEFSPEIKEELIKIFNNYLSSSESIIGNRFANEVDFIISGIKLAESGGDISKVATKVLQLSKEVTHLINEAERQKVDVSKDDDENSDSSEIKLKYKEGEQFEENYSMWVPPKDQTGDGRTSLNDKVGY